MSNKRNAAEPAQSQSDRFIEAAKKAGVDESGRKFAKVFKQVVKPKTKKSS